MDSRKSPLRLSGLRSFSCIGVTCLDIPFRMKTIRQTRRRFLHYLASVPAGIWAFAGGGGAPFAPFREVEGAPILTAFASAVNAVTATNASVISGVGKPIGNEVARLLNDSVAAATGKSDSRSAWRSLFAPGDVVGIKVNCLAGPGLSPHPELVAAIVDGVAGAGVPKEKIIVWDRFDRELEAAGFTHAGVNGAKVLATDLAGIGYERDIEFSGEIGSCFSRILSRMCTAIINVPVLKDHDLAGVSLGMKNFYGAIHNPNKYHDNNCDPYVADLCAHRFIKNKLRLVVCDALKGQYHGGPASRVRWSWPAATLIVGGDPVAVDRIGHEMIERKRTEAGMPPLKEVGREPKYIKTASQRGLGVGDLEKISRVKIS